MKLLNAVSAALAAIVLPIVAVSAMPARSVRAGAWEIGPTINGRNYSRGLFGATQLIDGWAFLIGPTAEPHYVTFHYGSLRGKREIRMRFRIEGPPGAIIYGANCPVSSPSAVTLYFQRRGDDWSTDGARWWATFASVPINGARGETEIVAPLDATWTSVNTMTAQNNPEEFAAAKADADRVGFTFANCEGYGHGARATLPVRFVINAFEVV